MPGAGGAQVPLAGFATITRTTAPLSITREDQLRLARSLLTDFFMAHLRRESASAVRVWLGSAPDGVSVARNPRTVVAVAEPSITAPAGTPVANSVSVTNAGSLPSAFALSSDPASGVAVAFAATTTDPVAPGQMVSVPFIVTVPASGPAVRTVQIRAQRLTDGVCAAADIAVTRSSPAADLTGDGVVNAQDLTILLASWGRCASGAPCAADLDGNGTVNGQDLANLVASWTS